MSYYPLLLVALFVNLSNGATINNATALKYAETPHIATRPEVKIVGGNVTDIKDVPYQVSIKDGNGQHFCGGTIISEYTILTAAHCIVGTSKVLYVVAGSSKMNGGKLNRVTLAVVHIGYNNSTMENDIAVLRVQKSLQLDGITRKSLPLANFEPKPGTMCTISGWGSTYFDPGHAMGTELIEKTQVPIYDRTVCVKRLDIPSDQICAGFEQGGHDSCQGDSGGPLECGGYITGVVSWGLGCGEPNLPGAYASVAYHREWILRHINSSLPSASITIQTSFILMFTIITTMCNVFRI
ncbi:serine-type endopeptidase activity [Nesidiocoris tenuis]|uniref:Serine-type endopeptidase activity n=1 Tax=Nesidiocoris tenuis TaxID=355587 RepID=A0ABN7A7M0_9HEMI|nr:serine-type endopeptidase activity [Nesidiocoris tenuis]